MQVSKHTSKESTLAGFEIQGRNHPKSKTGVPVIPQKWHVFKN